MRAIIFFTIGYVLLNIESKPQITGYVTYQTYFGSDDQFDLLKTDDYNLIKESFEVKVFVLEFNNNESVNYQKEILTPSLKYYNSDRFYYQNRNDKNYVMTDNHIVLGNITIKDSLKSDWQLTNETKLINNVLCFKATQLAQEFRGSDLGQTYNVIAWYAPEISAPFGLFEYGGLPGLILELQIRNVTYGADKIVLKPLKNSRLNRPQMQGKVLDEKGYIEKMESIMRSYKR